eukprot:20144-Eustigmatos_ZCMA.PRE.1
MSDRCRHEPAGETVCEGQIRISIADSRPQDHKSNIWHLLVILWQDAEGWPKLTGPAPPSSWLLRMGRR